MRSFSRLVRFIQIHVHTQKHRFTEYRTEKPLLYENTTHETKSNWKNRIRKKKNKYAETVAWHIRIGSVNNLPYQRSHTEFPGKHFYNFCFLYFFLSLLFDVFFAFFRCTFWPQPQQSAHFEFSFLDLVYLAIYMHGALNDVV